MNDQKQRDKCMKEVKLLEKLQHEFIIRYIESFIELNEMFIVVEWAEKGDLKQLIRQANSRQEYINERRVWHYLWQISSSLKHMAYVRVMHRDLKPANIFIDAHDNLKLGDLGLGRDFTSQTMEAFSRVGTPLYMSPEVLQGNGYDFKSDVWSLGCITYEMCALRSPFKDDSKKMSLYDLFTKINSGVYQPLSASRYSSELRYLIDSMLRVDPNDRVDINDVVIYCEKHIS
jgi:serine/threonine protein kinase